MSSQAMFVKYDVVIPAYNSQSSIGDAISSVLNQTILPTKIIVVDDFSEDNTKNIVLDLQKIYPAIELIALPKNCGPSAARNVGMMISTSAYIAFLDADDEWHPRKMELQLGVMSKFFLDISGSTVYVAESGVSNFKRKNYESVAIDCNFDLLKVKYSNLLFSNKFITPTVVLKNHQNFYFDESLRYAEDFDFWLRLLNSGKNGVIMDYPLAKLNKPHFGHSGLSANLMQMELCEIRVLLRQFKNSPLLSLFAIAYSIAKFVRRVLIVRVRALKT